MDHTAEAELCHFSTGDGGDQVPTTTVSTSTAMSTPTSPSVSVLVPTPRDGAGLADFPIAAGGGETPCRATGLASPTLAQRAFPAQEPTMAESYLLTRTSTTQSERCGTRIWHHWDLLWPSPRHGEEDVGTLGMQQCHLAATLALWVLVQQTTVLLQYWAAPTVRNIRRPLYAGNIRGKCLSQRAGTSPSSNRCQLQMSMPQ